jgi:hypothetical protein
LIASWPHGISRGCDTGWQIECAPPCRVGPAPAWSGMLRYPCSGP